MKHTTQKDKNNVPHDIKEETIALIIFVFSKLRSSFLPTTLSKVFYHSFFRKNFMKTCK